MRDHIDIYMYYIHFDYIRLANVNRRPMRNSFRTCLLENMWITCSFVQTVVDFCYGIIPWNQTLSLLSTTATLYKLKVKDDNNSRPVTKTSLLPL
jgi:hypothetical protein